VAARGTGPLPDDTINALRWLPTKDGIALGFTNCSAYHVLFLPDDTRGHEFGLTLTAEERAQLIAFLRTL
jgi:hypothetical protein